MFKPRIIPTHKLSETVIPSHILFHCSILFKTYVDIYLTWAIDAIDTLLSQLITFKANWIDKSVINQLTVSVIIEFMIIALLSGPCTHATVRNIAADACCLEV